MSISTEALKDIEVALESAAYSINQAISDANEDAPRGPESVSREPGVAGVESTDTKIIESVLRIAQVVGQRVQIDYTDEFGDRTFVRPITPTAFVHGGFGGSESVVANDDSRDGDVRRFRIDRITRVVA